MESKITIYRGTHQIGGCATEIATEEHRIIIDFGANLSGNDKISDDEMIVRVFDGRKCDAVLFTHYHGDHIGMFRKIPSDIPMYIGETAKKIMEIHTEMLDNITETHEKGLPIVQKMQCYLPAKNLCFGDIMVTPFVVDHSALDAYMFLIEVDGRKILFTGDFRDHGIVGENNRLEKTIRAYIGEVDILITEGVMLSREYEANTNFIQTEEDLGRRAAELFRENKESVVLVSSLNLDSIMEFYYALPDEMEFVCDSYQAKIILAAWEDKGRYYKKYRPKMINGKLRKLYLLGYNTEGLENNQYCEIANLTELWINGFTMLAREGSPMFKRILDKMENPLIIYSKWSGYLYGEHLVPKTVDFIGNHRMEKVHTSGHAYAETIEKLMRLTNPSVIIPMHTEFADAFTKSPEFMPYKDKIRVLNDGEALFFSGRNSDFKLEDIQSGRKRN